MKKNKTAFITGAASGLGKSFAENYAKQGYDLFLVDINQELLNQTIFDLKSNYSVNIHEFVADLTCESSIQHIIDEIKNKSIQIDALINNAGFGIYGKFSETKLQNDICMLKLHCLATIYFTKLMLPYMIERNSGEILNVSSLAGFQPGPMMSMYYSTKSMLISFTEALARENKDNKVKIGVLCPGVTDTSFKQNVICEKASKLKTMSADPSDVVSYAIEQLRKGDVVIIPGFKNKLISLLPRFVSRNVARNIVYKIQTKNRG